MVWLNSAPIGTSSRAGQSECHPGNTLKSVHLRFVGSLEEGHFPRRFLSEADVHQTRVNTRENDGRPGRTRTSDLFRVKEAL